MSVRRMLAAFALCLVAAKGRADDWPQWLGPNQAAVWSEDGIVEQFPEEGLPVKWRVPVELGYSGPVVAEGRVYLTDYAQTSGEITNNPGTRDELTGRERVLCFDAETGDEIWKYDYDQPYKVSYPGGPRAAPAVDAGRVYTIGAEGRLLCLDATDGTVHWEKDFKKEYGVPTPQWGFSAHPIVEGETLYCVVGGQGSVAVAFDKATGREVWRALSASEPGYCGPSMIEHGGVKQLIIWHPESVNALNPATGEGYWSVPLKPNSGMSIAIPKKYGDLLYAGGYGFVSFMARLDDADPRKIEVLWRGDAKTSVYCTFGPPILQDDMIYGADLETGALVGATIEDGERLWQTTAPTNGSSRPERYGMAFLVEHRDRFFIFNELGDLILAKLSREGYSEISRFHVLEPTERIFGRNVVWSHPAYANRCVFARNDKELVCVNLAAE
jgi:outer membrane protein assembly factor BamB